MVFFWLWYKYRWSVFR